MKLLALVLALVALANVAAAAAVLAGGPVADVAAAATIGLYVAALAGAARLTDRSARLVPSYNYFGSDLR